MNYTLDTNILINMERLYPREFFKSLWEEMEQLALSGEICICEIAHHELARGNDNLSSWTKNLKGFVCQTTAEEVLIVKEITQAHPGWAQEQRNYADPFIIAHAKHDLRAIVTEERRKGQGVSDKNQKIPNIADEHGVQCLQFFDFMRIQRWSF